MWITNLSPISTGKNTETILEITPQKAPGPDVLTGDFLPTFYDHII